MKLPIYNISLADPELYGDRYQLNSQDELLKRVRDDVDAISAFVKRTNIPVEQVLDKTSLDALCDSLKLDPADWNTEYLETILIIRDGLYTLRNDLRDRGDEDGAFSADQLLSSMDRLYADLERAMHSFDVSAVTKAHAEIAALMRTPYIDTRLIQRDVSELKAEVNELLTRTHVTFQNFEVHLMRMDGAEVIRTAKLVVQRMSATAFAIKLSLERNVIYQGVFRFLQEGADKILDELKALAEQFKRTYRDEAEFSSDLSSLVEKGSKLTRDIGNLLREVFSEGPIQQKQLKLKPRATVGVHPMVCAVRLDENRVALGGKDGWVYALNSQTGAILDHHRATGTTINCLARSQYAVVAGTESGLETINPATLVSLDVDAIYQENISAVAVSAWGVVSGTRDGIARRWTLDGTSIQKFGAQSLRLGKTIQRMLVLKDEVLVASGHTLFFVGDDFKVDRQIPIDFQILDMCPLGHGTLVVCGEGQVAQVRLSATKYTKYLAASETARYTCLAGIDSKTFCLGNDDGMITVVDVDSEAEIGVAKVPFPVRGLSRANNKLLAYGGSWKGKPSSTIVLLDWEEIIHRSKEIEAKPRI
jgi:hypothetical protein